MTTVGAMRRTGIAAAVASALAAMALLLAACTAAPASPTSTAPATPTASPTPTLAASACTWSGVRQQEPNGSLGHFAIALTNTSTGTCVLNGPPAASLSGGPHGTEPVAAGTASGLPAGAVVVPAGATAYAPVSLATTTDGGIDSFCTDSKHTTLELTPPGSPSTISVDVSLLHPCSPIPGFGWSVYPVQPTMPAAGAFP
jgi:hypothetical protein